MRGLGRQQARDRQDGSQRKESACAYCVEVSGCTALNKAATLRLGLMLAEMLLRAGDLAAASQAGAVSALLGS